MKNTPRDFFIHVGAFGALYLAAIALIMLVFRMIDFAFPDALQNNYYYSDPYSGPMRFAIASLIVLVPLFLFLMRMIQKEARRNPERRDLGVRRWLTYITLFIAGFTILGDLIALLNSFLGGALVQTFLLKVLALLVIMGAGFWYFILDIRGYWQERENTSKIVGGGVLLVVIATIVTGFFIMGSPADQREVRFDQEQIQDLSMIQHQVVSYWQENGQLPATLEALESNITGFQIPTAPEGRSEYEYERLNELSFTLCATFAQASGTYAESMAYENYGIRGSSSWKYEAGEHCFDRTIDTNLIKPVIRPQ